MDIHLQGARELCGGNSQRKGRSLGKREGMLPGQEQGERSLWRKTEQGPGTGELTVHRCSAAPVWRGRVVQMWHSTLAKACRWLSTARERPRAALAEWDSGYRPEQVGENEMAEPRLCRAGNARHQDSDLTKPAFIHPCSIYSPLQQAWALQS